MYIKQIFKLCVYLMMCHVDYSILAHEVILLLLFYWLHMKSFFFLIFFLLAAFILNECFII